MANGSKHGGIEEERLVQIGDIKYKIAAIDRNIAGLSGGLIGKYWNSNEIEQLERLRSEYQAKLDKKIRG